MRNRVIALICCICFISCGEEQEGYAGFKVNNLVDNVEQSLNKAMSDSYFTVEDLCHSHHSSSKGIDNTPSPEVVASLQAIINDILNPLRESYGSYIKVTSGYRSPKLNASIGGKSTSQHILGEAVDITAGSVKQNKQLFRLLIKQGRFDQIIWEKGGKWIHLSYRKNGNNRGDILAYKGSTCKNINSSWERIIGKGNAQTGKSSNSNNGVSKSTASSNDSTGSTKQIKKPTKPKSKSVSSKDKRQKSVKKSKTK